MPLSLVRRARSICQRVTVSIDHRFQMVLRDSGRKIMNARKNIVTSVTEDLDIVVNGLINLIIGSGVVDKPRIISTTPKYHVLAKTCLQRIR